MKGGRFQQELQTVTYSLHMELRRRSCMDNIKTNTAVAAMDMPIPISAITIKSPTENMVSSKSLTTVKGTSICTASPRFS